MESFLGSTELRSRLSEYKEPYPGLMTPETVLRIVLPVDKNGDPVLSVTKEGMGGHKLKYKTGIPEATIKPTP
jgi:hypothetical protein